MTVDCALTSRESLRHLPAELREEKSERMGEGVMTGNMERIERGVDRKRKKRGGSQEGILKTEPPSRNSAYASGLHFILPS